jgi:hypothetical protein
MFRGTFGTDYTEDNRIQAARTQDGTKVFITWLDTRLEGAEENTAPDIFIRGIAPNVPPNPYKFTGDENGEDMPVNVTTFSEAMWQSYFGVTASIAFDDGNGNYTVPMAYQQMTTPFDPALPVQFKYIQDFVFTDADFIFTGVNEQEEVKSITSVSQNYPNPFSQNSTVRVNLEQKASLSLVVTNLLGQQVMRIERGDVPAGVYDFQIDGSQLTNGVYFYTVNAGDESVTRKMVIE